MELRCCGTGSKGNSYCLITDDEEILILDCGVHYKAILKMIDYQISKVVGCLVTHEHKDHSLSVKYFKNSMIPIFQPNDKWNEIQSFKFGSFNIKSFPLAHDVPCIGFYIEHEDLGTMVYITDTKFCKYRFSNLNHILIESNYDKRILRVDHPAYKHIVDGHMELQAVKEFINANKSSCLQTIALCHMSENTYSYHGIEELKEQTGISDIRYVEVGKTINLNKIPF